jgi:hypothetical protein
MQVRLAFKIGVDQALPLGRQPAIDPCEIVLADRAGHCTLLNRPFTLPEEVASRSRRDMRDITVPSGTPTTAATSA